MHIFSNHFKSYALSNMKSSKSVILIKSYLVVGIILLNLTNLSAANHHSEFESLFTMLNTNFVTKQEIVINSTTLLPLSLIKTNQNSEDEEKPKEVKSNKKWYFAVSALIIGSVTAYLLLVDSGNGKAKIPEPPSRPANP